MKTALYIRVSTEDQAKEGYSLEVQREYLESFAKREGFEVFILNIVLYMLYYQP